MSLKVDTFIVKHGRTLGWIIASLMCLWYVSGIFAIEYIHPVAFVAIWTPIGLMFSFFAYKW